MMIKIPARFTVEYYKKSILSYIEVMKKGKKLKLCSKETKVGIYSFPLDYVFAKLFDCDDIVPDEYLEMLDLPLGLTFSQLAKKMYDFPKKWE